MKLIVGRACVAQAGAELFMQKGNSSESVSKVVKVNRLLGCWKKLSSESLPSQSVSAMKVIQSLEQRAQSCNVARKEKREDVR